MMVIDRLIFTSSMAIALLSISKRNAKQSFAPCERINSLKHWSFVGSVGLAVIENNDSANYDQS